MLVLREDIPAAYFASHASDSRMRAAVSSYRAWNALAVRATWETPPAIQSAHPKASILKAGRVVFNIKGNDYRLICKVDYLEQIVEIRWFGLHSDYNGIDAETI